MRKHFAETLPGERACRKEGGAWERSSRRGGVPPWQVQNTAVRNVGAMRRGVSCREGEGWDVVLFL